MNYNLVVCEDYDDDYVVVAGDVGGGGSGGGDDDDDDDAMSWSNICFLRVFCYKKSCVMDSRPMDQQTDKPSCRDLK